MKMSILLDLRCPKCNSPVYGKQDVKHVAKIAKPRVNCQRCKTVVVATEPVNEDIGLEAHYTEQK